MKTVQTTRAQVRLAAKMLRLATLGVVTEGITPEGLLSAVLAIAEDLDAIASTGDASKSGTDAWLKCKLAALYVPDPLRQVDPLGDTVGNA